MTRADAQALAALGWAVFPTRAKKPLEGTNGFNDATTSPGVDWPDDAQTAIAIPQGYVVVDVDDLQALAELEARHGPLPATLTAKSGKRGEHRWYRSDGAVLTQKKLAPGIDTRIGGKGYVVAPPSIHHETGKPYTWQTPALPVADAPAWLVEALEEKPQAPESFSTWPTPTTDALVAARKRLAELAPSIQGQDGSGSLMRAAGVLVRGYALGPVLGTQLLHEYNAQAVPPWPEHEIERAARNAATSAREPAIGSMLPDVDLLGAIRSARAPLVASIELDIDAIFEPLPPVDYLVHGIGITQGPPAMIAGYGFSGKTAAVQQLAIDLARVDWEGVWMMRRPVWGRFPAGRRAKVLHLDYEQGQNLTRRRYQRLAQAAGINAEALRGYLRVVPFPPWYTNTAPGFRALERAIEGFDLVIVDSFRASNPGTDENSSDAREPLDAMSRLSEKHGCAFLVIHHARKPNQDRGGGVKMAIRGSGAIFDGCSSVLVFESEDKTTPKLVHHEKEKTSGVPVDDFALVIEDVEGGGFRVRAQELTIKTPAERSQAETASDVEKIRGWLKSNIFFKNRDQIARAVGISNSRASAAIGAMQSGPTPEIATSGSYKDRTYHLSRSEP